MKKRHNLVRTCKELLEVLGVPYPPRPHKPINETSKQLLDKVYAKTMAITNSNMKQNTSSTENHAGTTRMAIIHRALRNQSEPDKSIERRDSQVIDDANTKRKVIKKFIELKNSRVSGTDQYTKPAKALRLRKDLLNSTSNPSSDDSFMPNGKLNYNQKAKSHLERHPNSVQIDPNNPYKVIVNPQG